MEWLYSPHVGLVGFTMVAKGGRQRPYWTTGEVGFGAPVGPEKAHNKSLNTDTGDAGTGYFRRGKSAQGTLPPLSREI